ncbi:DUF898 family protein [Bacillus horti]|uniref:Uncharacterized membrane protein YjgN (DUF898 family) n=1 Tax=Caldalkalibacillus horti TaxID=77523 RepID=A0ABT9VZ00_9BACI|nr:DUF898 family protein [Bacillus horti]MDQ0166114.1 uncharacterized membrane protein YjgN (DUF898 family) [Bacillus horti]
METVVQTTEQAHSAQIKTDSYFDGGLLQFIGWCILGFLVTVCTLGICYPWALCMVYGWKINHTVVEGRRLKFHGTAIGLFGNWIKWFLLCLITLGIYSFWLFIALEKWKAKHTTFA